MSSRNSAVSALALTWVTLTYAVLRFAHLQRSTILRVLDNAISGRASLGKRRTQGRRRPFDWRAPRWGITGLDLGAAVHSFITRAFAGGLQAAFFLPDLLPKRCTLQTCTGFASRSMSIGRFARLSQRMFQQAPFSMSAADASAFTSYSARRALPTIAELCKMDPHELLLVGDWKGKRCEQTDLSMPLRYADQKLHTSLCVKSELVCILRHAQMSGASPEMAWDKVSDFFPPRNESRKQAAQMLKSGLPSIYLPADVAPQSCDTSSGSSGSTSRSGSDCSSDSDGSSTDEAHPSPEEVQWLLSKGCKSHLHLCRPLGLQSKRWHTVCNRGLLAPQIGTGLEDAIDTGKPWSPRCYNSLSAICKTRWRELRGATP